MIYDGAVGDIVKPAPTALRCSSVSCSSLRFRPETLALFLVIRSRLVLNAHLLVHMSFMPFVPFSSSFAFKAASKIETRPLVTIAVLRTRLPNRNPRRVSVQAG